MIGLDLGQTGMAVVALAILAGMFVLFVLETYPVEVTAIGGAALMTGAAVALAGAIGFVGVVAPHLARPLTGHDPGRAILPSALIGGATLALADLVIRLAPFEQELKLGVAAALIGAPAFIWIAARTQRIAS